MGIFTRLVNKFDKASKVFQEIGNKKILKIGENERGNVGFFFKKEDLLKLSANVATVLLENYQSEIDIAELFLMSEVLGKGPKIFQPTQVQFSMLEQIELNIPIEEYNQPFEIIILELPSDYCKIKSTMIPDCSAISSKDYHEPTMVISYYNRELRFLLISTYFTSDVAFKSLIRFNEGEIIEGAIPETLNKAPYHSKFLISEEEKIIQGELIRSIMNYCLLLDEIGLKKVGPENENYYNRLLRYKSKNNQNSSSINNQIKAQPIIYSLNQEVKLYKTVANHSELSGNNSGKVLTPHHRRGFYKMQPYGIGHSLRKRIRINPVFVNAHLFGGNLCDTKVSYS